MLINLIYFTYYFTYGLLHSALATARIKGYLTSRIPALKVWYRLLYNLTALLLLVLPAVHLLYSADKMPWNAPFWLQVLGWIFLFTGAIFGWTAFQPYDTAAFLGTSRSQDNTERLVVHGLQSVVRHPLYTATLMLLIGMALAFPDFRILSATAGLTLYLPLGIYWEEKKLKAVHGTAYQEYSKDKKRLIPGVW